MQWAGFEMGIKRITECEKSKIGYKFFMLN
jgi:hypothetical protein